MQRSIPSIGSGRAGRARALLAAAIAASVLLPFSGGAPTIASAAAPPSTDLVARAAESPDGLIHLALTPGESEARYIMTVKTLGQAPKTPACSTRQVTGEIVLAPDGSIVAELSKIVVDQRTLKCQAPLSDSRAQNLLQTAQHPMAEFAAKSSPGLGVPLPTGDVVFQLVGDQTVKGVTRPTTYESTATLTADTMVGKARTTLKMTDFGITPPSIGPLVQVSDEMVAEVDIKASIGGPAAAGAPAPAASPAADPAAADPAAVEPSSDEAAEPTP
jgi:polyisoprenoid-binding protein YceI